MRRLAFFAIGTFFGVAAIAQGLLDCIEPDILRAMLFQSTGEPSPVITSAVPEEISSLKMPREFTWIGSAERQQGRVNANLSAVQVTAAWRSSLAPDAARTATAAALKAAGWEVQVRSTTMAVFNTSTALVPDVACHDGKPMNVTSSAFDGVTYMLFAIQRGSPNNSACNQPVLPVATRTGLNAYLPKLDLPVDPVSGAAARTQSSSSGSSSDDVNAQVQFQLKDSAANIGRYLARQMASQGWLSDASWSGMATAGSSWSKRPDANTIIQGTLTVTAISDTQLAAMFRVIRLQVEPVMRKLVIIVSSLAVFTIAAQAQEAFQCANPDVLNSLVFNARPESKLVVKRTLPDVTDGFLAPTDFKLIGSGVRGKGASTMAAYKTSLEARKAFDDWFDLLSAQGWHPETPQGTPPNFSVQRPQPLAVRLCKNGERRNMLVQEIEGVRYGTIFGVETNPPRACNAPVPQQILSTFGPTSAARASMPQFSFPPSTHISTPGNSGMSFGGQVSTRTRIESPETATSLVDHLSKQLVTQGWQGDAEWSGTLSSGSSWTRKGDDGQVSVGTLEIISLGKGAYEVGFTLTSRPL